MLQRILLAAFGYLIVSFALGATWHFVIFPDLYHDFGIYNRASPIIPLGVVSMLVQGVVMAWIFPRFARTGGAPLAEGVKFGLLMGAFLFSVSTLANAAKIEVSSLGQFVAVQLAFHVLQFGLAGVVFGLVFGRREAGALAAARNES